MFSFSIGLFELLKGGSAATHSLMLTFSKYSAIETSGIGSIRLSISFSASACYVSSNGLVGVISWSEIKSPSLIICSISEPRSSNSDSLAAAPF